MTLPAFPFQTIDWQSIPAEVHNGTTGMAWWQIFMMGNIRIRKVRYSANYQADHWCKKGHIILCMEGSMETTLEDGRIMHMEKGMTYVVGDSNEAHQTYSAKGCELFIVD